MRLHLTLIQDSGVTPMRLHLTFIQDSGVNPMRLHLTLIDRLAHCSVSCSQRQNNNSKNNLTGR